MTRKLNLLWISAENKIRSLVEDFKTEELQRSLQSF